MLNAVFRSPQDVLQGSNFRHKLNVGHCIDSTPLSFKSTVSTLAPLLIRIQVDLCAQVEVEKGVDAEDEEQDCCDDEERILR